MRGKPFQEAEHFIGRLAARAFVPIANRVRGIRALQFAGVDLAPRLAIHHDDLDRRDIGGGPRIAAWARNRLAYGLLECRPFLRPNISWSLRDAKHFAKAITLADSIKSLDWHERN